jgi:hypothetical protein
MEHRYSNRLVGSAMRAEKNLLWAKSAARHAGRHLIHDRSMGSISRIATAANNTTRPIDSRTFRRENEGSQITGQNLVPSYVHGKHQFVVPFI